jgi:gluconolactonase
MKTKKLFLYLGITMLIASCNNTQDTPEKILDGYCFTEGPAVNKEGILFFSDVPERKIYQYPLTKKEASLFLDNTGGANGLYFDSKGNMIACAGKARMVISISP